IGSPVFPISHYKVKVAVRFVVSGTFRIRLFCLCVHRQKQAYQRKCEESGSSILFHKRNLDKKTIRLQHCYIQLYRLPVSTLKSETPHSVIQISAKADMWW